MLSQNRKFGVRVCNNVKRCLFCASWFVRHLSYFFFQLILFICQSMRTRRGTHNNAKDLRGDRDSQPNMWPGADAVVDACKRDRSRCDASAGRLPTSHTRSLLSVCEHNSRARREMVKEGRDSRRWNEDQMTGIWEDACRCGRLAPRQQRWCGSMPAWPLRFVLGLALVCGTAAVCGDSIFEPGEECDDGNVMDNDGCSGQCKTEPLAFMTWYASANCTGKIYKQEIFNDREYVRSKHPSIKYDLVLRVTPLCLACCGISTGQVKTFANVLA